MRSEKAKVDIASKGYSAQSLITVNSFIEFGSFATDGVFVEIREGEKIDGYYRYSKEKSVRMLFDATQVRALSYAMKEFAEYKNNDFKYKNNTESNRLFKTCFLGYSQTKEMEEAFFINMHVKNMQTKQIETKVSVKFSRWDFLSFSDSLMLIAEGTERTLFKYQRELKKALK